jgi:hypothetical protein
VDPDNTDGYTYPNTGFPLTAADALAFLTFLSSEARAQGLGIGLKNSLELISPANMPLWDFAVNEQCYQYNECGLYAPFKAGVLGCGWGRRQGQHLRPERHTLEQAWPCLHCLYCPGLTGLYRCVCRTACLCSRQACVQH